MSEENKFQLRIITPDRVFYEGEASMVEMNTTDGEIGVYSQHVPTTFILMPGVLTIHEDGEEKYAALHAGFAEVLQSQVTVLAEAAEWPDEIDVERAERAKARAEERLSHHADNINQMRAESALRRALTRIEVGR
jgi:F-type H+-transporting ATPase subunit epsilon